MKQPVYSPGTIVAGRYRIDKAIARGGCSIVYRGTHIEMERTVALKIMSADGGALDRAWTQRFKREARLASQLRHPNTIIIYDYGHDQGLWFIAMEWVEGDSLRNVVRDGGPVEPLRAARFTVQMLKSLVEAHRQHILHRDLKPSNVMITRDLDGEEMVKVLDFGLAKADPSEWRDSHHLKLTREGDFVGTPRYASPEQLRGRELSRASDIYGVGMVMWEMLMGQPAVPGVEYAVCVEHHLSERPWQMPPGRVPPGLAMIVEKSLAKDDSARFPSCEAMLEPLMRWIHDDGNPIPRVEILEDDHDLFFGDDDEFFGLEDSPLSGPPLELSGPSDPLDELSASESDEAGLEEGAPPGAPPRGRDEELRHGGTRRASARGPMATGAFSELQSDDLELDARARRRTSPSGQPGVSSSSRSSGGGGEDAPNDAAKIIGVVAALTVAVTVVGLLTTMSFGEDPEQPRGGGEAGDALVEEIQSAKEAEQGEALTGDLAPPPPAEPSAEEQVAEVMATRQPKDLMVLLRHDKWFFVQKPETVDLGDVQQTTLRVRRRRATVDVTFYQAQELALARELERKTDPGSSVVRLGHTVVRMAPVGSQGSRGVSELYERMLEIKRASR